MRQGLKNERHYSEEFKDIILTGVLKEAWLHGSEST